tara:strand:+ start:643 stop:837 length:195 start_codon:yes stop_codon:yes gene_type:complete
MSIEPSPFRPQTTIAIEKVKIAANEAQPKVKIIIGIIFFDYNLLKMDKLILLEEKRVIKRINLK